MSSSLEKTGLCTRKKVHIIPTEWASYPTQTLDCIVYSGVKEH
ncbi:GSCOCT00014296001.2-RA-CDS [Cotesia congregata]|uniref:Cc_bv6.2_29.4_pseudo n=1 Tax=Cotesia congregata TaxID=51543 RepID=A0A8J2ML28_COTCN|nr:GSCOCT00014296001.2-RA-CDS [Cotesia congregata]CAG5092407.1 cc_bv6.2_29.4_pseudo [Cotesia congregata]